jgi:hypothetical protein
MDILPGDDATDNATYCNNRQDVVGCVGGLADDWITTFVQSTLVNVPGIHILYLVAPDASFADVTALVSTLSIGPKCVVVNETTFPFSQQTVDTYGSGAFNVDYFHQLVHLYAWKVIQGITARHLVLDAATFFVTPTPITASATNLYSYTSGYNADVFTHMHNMHPFFRCNDESQSGDCGHMMFESRHLSTIFALVELRNNQNFYSVFLACVSSFDTKTASEYELFFNFLPLCGFSNFIYRPLSWRTGTLADVATTTDVNYLVVS